MNPSSQHLKSSLVFAMLAKLLDGLAAWAHQILFSCVHKRLAHSSETGATKLTSLKFRVVEAR